ncbi:hypothetical protein CSAL01_01730 [Colletotrichum salicis]|uniref:Uncharacterized protein n=1 Tax=Colletotrichum salicis TaxID=1209931 RepID=A0A135V9H1_9PEZI|nr:hypothetical protein CSAL01_01730 [Colletotrichum salicis]
MNLYQLSKLLFLVALIDHGETAPAKADFRAPRLYVVSNFNPYRTTLPIDRTLRAGSFREPVLLTDSGDSYSPKSQELPKEQAANSVTRRSTATSSVGDKINENKSRIRLRTLQSSSGSLHVRSKPGAFPWAGLNPQGTYPWTRTIICMAICERNTYHMRDILKGNGRWQACILKCKSDGSMTDITGEIYESSFKEDFAPLSYYKGYLDYISDQTGVVKPKNWFLEWRPAY